MAPKKGDKKTAGKGGKKPAAKKRKVGRPKKKDALSPKERKKRWSAKKKLMRLILGDPKIKSRLLEELQAKPKASGSPKKKAAPAGAWHTELAENDFFKEMLEDPDARSKLIMDLHDPAPTLELEAERRRKNTESKRKGRATKKALAAPATPTRAAPQPAVVTPDGHPTPQYRDNREILAASRAVTAKRPLDMAMCMKERMKAVAAMEKNDNAKLEHQPNPHVAAPEEASDEEEEQELGIKESRENYEKLLALMSGPLVNKEGTGGLEPAITAIGKIGMKESCNEWIKQKVDRRRGWGGVSVKLVFELCKKHKRTLADVHLLGDSRVQEVLDQVMCWARKLLLVDILGYDKAAVDKVFRSRHIGGRFEQIIWFCLLPNLRSMVYLDTSCLEKELGPVLCKLEPGLSKLVQELAASGPESLSRWHTGCAKRLWVNMAQSIGDHAEPHKGKFAMHTFDSLNTRQLFQQVCEDGADICPPAEIGYIDTSTNCKPRPKSDAEKKKNALVDAVLTPDGREEIMRVAYADPVSREKFLGLAMKDPQSVDRLAELLDCDGIPRPLEPGFIGALNRFDIKKAPRPRKRRCVGPLNRDIVVLDGADTADAEDIIMKPAAAKEEKEEEEKEDEAAAIQDQEMAADQGPEMAKAPSPLDRDIDDAADADTKPAAVDQGQEMAKASRPLDRDVMGDAKIPQEPSDESEYEYSDDEDAAFGVAVDVSKSETTEAVAAKKDVAAAASTDVDEMEDKKVEGEAKKAEEEKLAAEAEAAKKAEEEAAADKAEEDKLAAEAAAAKKAEEEAAAAKKAEEEAKKAEEEAAAKKAEEAAAAKKEEETAAAKKAADEAAAKAAREEAKRVAKEAEEAHAATKQAVEPVLVETVDDPVMCSIKVMLPDCGGEVKEKFLATDTVKAIYTFVEKRLKGRKVILKTRFPNQDLALSMNKTIASCGLSGLTILGEWVYKTSASEIERECKRSYGKSNSNLW